MGLSTLASRYASPIERVIWETNIRKAIGRFFWSSGFVVILVYNLYAEYVFKVVGIENFSLI